jgi:cation:H+ antiporter
LTSHAIILALSFGTILLGSELFTNGVEWAGERFGMAEAAVGSLLAAVGTALPETFIPAIALFMSRGRPGPHSAVGVGAIVGAPLMLSTVALLVMGVAAIVFKGRRDRVSLIVAREDARRDLGFFLPIFATIVLIGAVLNLGPLVRRLMAVLLLCVYAFYAWTMLQMRRSSDAEVENGLYLERLLGGRPDTPRLWMTVAQVFAGTLAILIGARTFVVEIVRFSGHVGISPGVLSLILSPLATELPEKYNSVIWIRQRKDNLALANITGAMVFQSCIPVALGLAYTPWHLGPPEVLAGAITVASCLLLYANLRASELKTPSLMLGGVAYACFIAGLVWLGVL